MQDAMTPSSKLFVPLTLGSIGRLTHRVVLAPMTRNRSLQPSLAPSDWTVQYYRQRASPGGLLITEATHITPESLCYPSSPGIWSQEQVEGWKKVTNAVHDKGGFIVCQLWHTGRVAHSSFGNHPAAQEYFQKTGRNAYPGVSSSAVGIVNHKGEPGQTLNVDDTLVPFEVPRPLSADIDIPRLVQDYQAAARNAIAAGFDGIELHFAHGYLVDQFLNNGVNQRTDQYGGSVENRCRLMMDILGGVTQVIPADKIGVRLSPHNGPDGGYTYNGATDDDPDAVYVHAVKLLDKHYPNLAYLMLTEPRWRGKYDTSPETDPGFEIPLSSLGKCRPHYRGLLMGAGGFTPASSYANMPLAQDGDSYDLIAFGRWFISNPDLPERIRQWHAYEAGGRTGPVPAGLNRYDRSTFYSHEPEGYIDYPSLSFLADDDRDFHPAHQGMVRGKYPIMDQGQVGTSTKSKL